MQKRSKIYEYIAVVCSSIMDAASKINSSHSNVSLSRIYWVLAFFYLSYSLVSLKLFSATVLPNLYEKPTANITQHKKDISLDRAEILDRNGELIAINLVTTSVYINPNVVTDSVSTAKKLSRIFSSLRYSDILKKLQSNSSFAWIKRNVSPREEQLVHDLGIPGIYFERSEKRAYPHGSLFAHVLGYVGLDGKGLSGIERYLDNELRVNENKETNTLTLSLDSKAQNIIRDELSKAIVEFEAKGGIGILQDVNNGEIIAMVSLPDYDPHNPGRVSEEALFNKATLGSYEVGSIFKAFTMAMALDSNSTRLNNVYDVDKPISMAGYQIKDFRGKGGWLSVPEILMHSSNIGISQIALEMGKNKQFEYLKTLGLLSPLEIELYEKATPSYSPLVKWNNLNVVTASYGHGISVSPLHTVNAMSALVNGGKLYNPTLIKDKSSEYKRVLKESTSLNMRKLLRMVVRFGRAKKAEVDGICVGGKTGTANKVMNGKYSTELRLSSFISTFPAYEPRYVMLISIDEPKGNKETFGFATGGWVATPVTARIVEKLAPILGIYPELDKKEDRENLLFVQYNPSNSSVS